MVELDGLNEVRSWHLNNKLMFWPRKLIMLVVKLWGMLKRLCYDWQEVVFISLLYISLYKSFRDHVLHSKNNGMKWKPRLKKSRQLKQNTR